MFPRLLGGVQRAVFHQHAANIPKSRLKNMVLYVDAGWGLNVFCVADRAVDVDMILCLDIKNQCGKICYYT